MPGWVLPSPSRPRGQLLLGQAVQRLPVALPPPGDKVRLDLPVDLVVGDLAGSGRCGVSRGSHLRDADYAGVQQAEVAAPAQVVGVVDAGPVAVRRSHLLVVMVRLVQQRRDIVLAEHASPRPLPLKRKLVGVHPVMSFLSLFRAGYTYG